MNISYIINSLFSVNGKNKNIRIAEAKSLTVEADAYAYAIEDQSLADYPYHYVVVKADNSHIWRASEQFKTDTFQVPGTADIILDHSTTAATRDITDWIKAKGETVTIMIKNLDTANAHTYNIYLIGVK